MHVAVHNITGDMPAGHQCRKDMRSWGHLVHVAVRRVGGGMAAGPGMAVGLVRGQAALARPVQPLPCLLPVITPPARALIVPIARAVACTTSRTELVTSASVPFHRVTTSAPAAHLPSQDNAGRGPLSSDKGAGPRERRLMMMKAIKSDGSGMMWAFCNAHDPQEMPRNTVLAMRHVPFQAA